MKFENGRGFEKPVVFEKSVLISRLTECFSFMCVMVKKEGGF